jgi:hypothetical protein
LPVCSIYAWGLSVASRPLAAASVLGPSPAALLSTDYPDPCPGCELDEQTTQPPASPDGSCAPHFPGGTILWNLPLSSSGSDYLLTCNFSYLCASLICFARLEAPRWQALYLLPFGESFLSPPCRQGAQHSEKIQ